MDCERCRAYYAAIVNLNLIRLIGRSNLAVPLQTRDYVDERRIGLWLNGSLGVRGGDDVGSRLLDYAEPVEF